MDETAGTARAAETADERAADDAFCIALCKAYDADPDKGEAISIEEAARQLGVTLLAAE